MCPAGDEVSLPLQDIRHDWTLSQLRELYDLPLLDLVFRAAGVHRRYHDSTEVQVCKLISIKTGG